MNKMLIFPTLTKKVKRDIFLLIIGLGLAAGFLFIIIVVPPYISTAIIKSDYDWTSLIAVIMLAIILYSAIRILPKKLGIYR